MSKENIMNRTNGWNVYAMHGNTYKLRMGIAEKLNELFGNG